MPTGILVRDWGAWTLVRTYLHSLQEADFATDTLCSLRSTRSFRSWTSLQSCFTVSSLLVSRSCSSESSCSQWRRRTTFEPCSSISRACASRRLESLCVAETGVFDGVAGVAEVDALRNGVKAQLFREDYTTLFDIPLFPIICAFCPVMVWDVLRERFECSSSRSTYSSRSVAS